LLLAPLVVLAIPVLYATWRVRRRRLLAEEDQNAREFGVRKTFDHALVETVSEREQNFDKARKV
jgi:hypothetical protein